MKVLWHTYRRSWLPIDLMAAMPWWLSGVNELKLLQVCTSARLCACMSAPLRPCAHPLPHPPHPRTRAPAHPRTPHIHASAPRTPGTPRHPSTSAPPHICPLTRTSPPHLRTSAPLQLLRLAKLATIRVKPMKGGIGNLLRILRMMFIYSLAAHWASQHG